MSCARLLGDEEEEVHDVLGLALEALAQLRVLRRDAHRARVQVAGAHHDAARRDQRRGARSRTRRRPAARRSTTSRPVLSWPSVCTQMRERRSLSTSVCWVSARPISHGMPAAWMLEQRRRAGAAVVAGDQHVVGVRLRHARRDRAHADLGHQLHRDPRARVGAAQVVDQLLEVLDRVDVVVRRRRDQAHARRREADRADVAVDLVARQLAALAGLGALGHLDLQLVGVDEVVDVHAEAAGGHLLDRRAAQVAVRVGREADRVLPALAGVRLAAEAVHRDRQRLVRLAAERAQRHRAGDEALDDLARRLDVVERRATRPRAARGTSAGRAASPGAPRPR